MNIVISEVQGVTILLLETDRLDAHNADTLKEKLRETFEGSAKYVLVDLQHVRFIDSSGLGALVSGFKNAVSHRGRLALSGLQGQVQSMFDLTRLYRVFEIFPAANDALVSLARQ